MEGLDTRLKSQKNKWSSLSYGQSTFENEISRSIDSEANRTNGLNNFQIKDEEEESSPLEERLVIKIEDNERQHLLGQGEADQEGSRCRRTSGKPFSTLILESSDHFKPSEGGFGGFWERLLEWLDSVFARLFSSGSP